jgi:hypothetical protein
MNTLTGQVRLEVRFLKGIVIVNNELLGATKIV